MIIFTTKKRLSDITERISALERRISALEDTPVKSKNTNNKSVADISNQILDEWLNGKQ